MGQEDALEKGMATHSSILAWRTPWTEETGGLQSMGSQKSPARLSDQHFHPSSYTLLRGSWLKFYFFREALQTAGLPPPLPSLCMLLLASTSVITRLMIPLSC